MRRSIPEIELAPLAHPLSFRFDFSNAHHIEDFFKSLSALTSRIDRLMTEPTIAGQPVISIIMLQLHQSLSEIIPEELEKTGKALIRIAELLPTFVKMQQTAEFINFARAEPDTTAWAFGHFSDEIDSFTHSLQNDENTDKDKDILS